jgi:HlyD family secretion protein
MRVVISLFVVTLVLVALIAYRLRLEEQKELGPSGGSGTIEAIAVDLSARIVARVVELNVKEGQTVKKGDLLLRLDCSEPLALLAEANARVAATEAQAVAAGANVAATERSRAAALAGQEAAKAQTAALEAQREAAERQALRLESIPNDVPLSNVDQSRAVALGLSHQVEAAKAQANASAAQARAVSVQINASSAQVEAAKAQIVAARAAVVRAELLVSECEVRAPLDAEVATLPYEVGELSQLNSTLVRLVSSQQLVATFYLPNAEVAVAKPGASALVSADAWPGETFAGTIRTVALEAEFTPRNIQTRSDRDRLVYPIEVDITNPAGKLRAGMPVQVVLPGTERRRDAR